MSLFGIAAIQMEVAARDNRGRMRALIAETRQRFPWVRLVLFSELCALGNDLSTAAAMPGPVEQSFCEMAAEFGIWLVPGSLLEVADGKIFNTLPVIDPAGKVVERYRKVFPWYPYEVGIASGDSFKVFDIPGVGRFGVSICYDMMLPETTRELVFLGAEVILHPTMTTTLDRQQELVVGRANAIFNQCYFLDVNGTGPLGVGQSQLVGPEGEVLYLAGERELIMPFRVDFTRLRNVRRLGTAGTVQMLKSFRDRAISFKAYQAGAVSPDLDALGPLMIPDD